MVYREIGILPAFAKTAENSLVDAAAQFADEEISANKPLPKNADSLLSQEFVATFIDSALEAGIDSDFKIESDRDRERVAKNRHIRTALSWASVQALRVLDDTVERAKTDEQRRHAEEDRQVTQEGAERLFELFGIVTRPKQEKVTTQEIPTIFLEPQSSGKPVHIRAIEAINGVTNEISKSYEGMAINFGEIYMKGQARIDSLRDIFGEGSRYPKTEQDRAEKEFMQTIASMNVYSHRLSNILHALKEPSMQRSYVHTLQKTVAKLIQGKESVNPSTDEQILFNQMITGIALEVASTRVLSAAAEQYGWTEVRGSTIKEDVKDQTDVFVTVDGVAIPLDIKSSRSFNKQHGYDIHVPGIKIKKAKSGNKVIVVDAQGLGDPDRYTDLAFEFQDGDAVVQAVSRAVNHLLHRN